MTTTTRLGANYDAGVTQFRVWAPDAASVQLVLESDEIAMRKDSDGFWNIEAPARPGGLYRYRVDGQGPFPDPASRSQPQGVHGPSAVVDPDAFVWTDRKWAGIALDDAIFYELHVGTFTRAGTFAAAAALLPALADLGVTAIELMPVADFPGNRNWGYDGVAIFAPARCYGTPDEMRAFVDRAHGLRLAVFLDVVYNHFGPDGAYQGVFSKHYYSKTHRSPWGDGINVDGPLSQPVRDYFAENAERWVREYHLDGLRLDATHAIVDDSPRHVATYIADTVRAAVADSPRRVHVIAEDHHNLADMVRSVTAGGWGLDGVWADDFHHQIRVALAGDRDGYFQDFDGTDASIAETARQGWFYCGQQAPHFGEARGSDPAGLEYKRFVVCIQNHDQIGNRALGDRLHHAVDLAAYRAASALLLLLPETPLLFMGQEWAATSPFQYFTDHNEELGRLVTAGRRREFAGFQAFADAEQQARIPDPQALATFEASKLRWDERNREPHASLLRMYRSLLRLRRSESALRCGGVSPGLDIRAQDEALLLHRQSLLAVVRLRGSGTVAIPTGWSEFWSTEDDAFAPDPEPAVVADRTIQFLRPGAVLLRSNEEGGA